MSSESYKVGDATVTRVVETTLPGFAPAALFPEGDAMGAESVTLAVHTWVVRTPRHLVLVDTGIGNHKVRPGRPIYAGLDEPFLARLAQAGVTPEVVDAVLLTHLHTDHVGWNTRLEGDRWVPTFPNARYVVPEIEMDRLQSQARRDDFRKGLYDDSVAPVVEAGLFETVGPNGGEPVEGFHFFPTPGHSAGHMSIGFESAGAWGLFGGDVMHHPLQFARPDLNSVFCEAEEPARASRRWALGFAADRGARYFSSHFDAPASGRVERVGDRFDWHPES